MFNRMFKILFSHSLLETINNSFQKFNIVFSRLPECKFSLLSKKLTSRFNSQIFAWCRSHWIYLMPLDAR